MAAAAGLVLLGALLIDFSRIAAFRHASLLAVQSGVRSVLSSYDPEFYERYGLFIRGGDAGDELFRSALEQFSAGSDDRRFAYAEGEWLNAGVLESRPLADHDVFRRQVLEEMKYKAPVDVALELAEKFRGVAPGLKEAAATADLLERMRQAYEQREAELDKILAAQIQWGHTVIASLYELFPELHQAAYEHRGYLSQVRWLANVGPEADPMAVQARAMAIAEYESRVFHLVSALSAESRKVAEETERLASESMEALLQAKAINGEMRRMAEESAGGAASYNPPETNRHGEGGDAGSEVMAEIRNSVWQLVLDESFFTEWSKELELQADRSRALSQTAGRAAESFASIGSADETVLKQAAADLEDNVNRYADAYGGSGSVIAERRAVIQQHRDHEGEQKDLEKKAQEEWAGWRGLLGRIRSVQGTQEEKEGFQKVSRLAKENLVWNEGTDSQEEQTDLDNPAAGRDAAQNHAGRLLDGLEDTLTGKRDDLFFAEYAHARFPRFSPADVRKLLHGEEVSLAIDRQEAEFILYGLAHPAGNIAAAYSEIFAFRLAVRTMEGLIESRSAGHPLLILAAALVYGVKHAVEDIYSLLNEDSVPLSRHLSIPTSYADYLRLFYLLHGGSPENMSRFIAVMEHRTGLALTRAYTYVSGEGIASLRLWFFPELLKWTGRTGHLGGTVKGNRYEAEFIADSSYQ
jgi:hypothetical protein